MVGHPWFLASESTGAIARLVLFPHAGGSASFYRGWITKVGADLELCLVRYPGRGTRLNEAPPTSLLSLASAVADATKELPVLPTVFLGHSMGALVAFEAAKILCVSGQNPPLHLIASACAAPDTPRDIPNLGSSNLELVEWLRALGGTPEDVYENPELLELILEPIRCDLQMLGEYEYSGGHPLTLPITVLTGCSDSAINASAWQKHTLRKLHHVQFPGGHYFLREAGNDVLGMVTDLVTHINERQKDDGFRQSGRQVST